MSSCSSSSKTPASEASTPDTNWRKGVSTPKTVPQVPVSGKTTPTVRDLPPHRFPSKPKVPQHSDKNKAVSASPATILPSSDNMSQRSSPIIAGSPDVTTTNLEPIPSSRLGMERGYSLSPMYSLILEYNAEKGNNLSTAAEVSWILQKPCLKPQDIEVREVDSDSHTAIRVVDSKMQPILCVVTELQTFLERMARLIQEQNSVFCIDPRETMTTALQGCASRSQLELAYMILHKRLLVTQQTVTKYEAQYRQVEVPLSPLSTVPDLYDEFNNIKSVDDRMRFMLNNVPRHQSQILPGAREALQKGFSWDVICPTLPLPSTSSQPATEFPQASNSQGKKKVDWEVRAPWEGASTSMEQGQDLDEGLEPSFGFQTPFKKGTRFFDTSTDGLSTTYFSTPGPNSIPDVTIGLATPSKTELGENVREYSITQGTSTLNVARQATNFTQTTTAALASTLLIKNASPFSTNDFNGTTHTPPGRGGGNDPPYPGGGGGGLPYPGGGGGGGNGGGNSPARPPQSNGNPNGGGGGGGAGDPGGGGGGGPPSQGNEFGPPAPYGNIPASIKTELKVEQLPEWDGNHWTAIDYFWQIQQLAYLGGWLPEALGYWLWFRLKDGSPVRRWFVTLPVTHQSFM